MSRTQTLTRGPALSLIAIGAGLVLIGVAALLTLDWRSTAFTESQPSAIPAQVAFPAPDLQLDSLDGRKNSLAGYRGQVVLVNIWATWCPPCRAEMPALEAYYQDHKAAGFVVVAVDAGDAVADVSEFVESMGLSFPVWLDPQLAALAAFRYTGLPSSYVIDRDGIVRLAWTGAITREMLDRHLTPLLDG